MRTDSPIKERKHDLLDRYDFAVDIVEGLLSSFETGQDSITVGLNGEWGSGKSSVLEFIATEIEVQTKTEETSNIIFKFNPWLFTGQADLQKSFLTQLGIHLRTINPELKKLAEDIILISMIIESANTLNPSILTRAITKTSTKLAQQFAKRIGNEPSLQILKERIDSVLEESSIKVYVIIDDIDRLIPSEIANIFRLVNLNANFKNTFFFLSYDISVVTKSFETTFNINGEQYLEKIIQLDYSIPKLYPEVIEMVFFENINILARTHNVKIPQKELRKVWNVGLKTYFTNFRHINRFFNALEIRYKCIQNDVALPDFITIEAIRIFDNLLYEWIYQNKTFLVAKNSVLKKITDVELKGIPELIESLSTDKYLQESKDLTHFIFDSILYKENSFGTDKKSLDILEKEKRIAHPDYFEHYFSFKVSKNNIPQAEIDNFLTSSDDAKDIQLKKYIRNDLWQFLKRVNYCIPEDFNIEALQKYMLDFSDMENLQAIRKDEYHAYGVSIIINFLNDIGNKFGFETYIEEILASTKSYSRFYILSFLRNKCIGAKNINHARLFPDELVKENKDRILGSFEKSFSYFSKHYLSDPLSHEDYIVNDLLRLLYDLSQKEYQNKISEYEKDIESCLLLFRLSLTTVTSAGVVSYFIQNEEHILPELTIERFDKVLGDVLPDKYTGRYKEYLQLFHNLKNKNFKPSYHYNLEQEEVYF